MMRKKTLFKNTFREIWYSKSRFLSIVLIVFLGCSFYVGLKATGPNMIETAKTYQSRQNLADLSYRSTIGFDEEVIELFDGVSGIKNIELHSSQDVILTSKEEKIVVSAFSYSPDYRINKLTLTGGQLPKDEHQILIEDNYKLRKHYSIGDYLSLGSEENQPLMIADQKYEIVGTVRSPQFISYDRGFTNLGDGIILSFIYIPESNFLAGYTDLYIRLDNENIEAYSDEYKQWIKKTKEEFEPLFQDYVEEKNAEWFAYDRSNLPGYSYFIEDVEKVNKIAGVVPLFFIFIAILVCLTSMTRMVDEERLEVGTLCALGFSKFDIVSKYILYTLFATLLGSLLGGIFGFFLLPNVIFNAFDLYYLLPELTNIVRWNFLIIGVLVSVFSILVATLMASYQLLRAKPSVLMRPKSPIAGKKIVLERFGLLWNRFSFNFKMTFRNLFRYKRRAIITIIGIAGCAGLMITGFGLQNAIKEISTKQFESIFLYDGALILQTEPTAEFSTYLDEETRINEYTYLHQSYVDVKTKDKTIEVYLCVLDENYSDFVMLRNRKTQKPLELDDDGIIINEGLANKYGYKVNDFIEIVMDDEKYLVRVSAITENYTYNYLYFSVSLYEELFNKSLSFNQVFFTINPEVDEKVLKQDLLTTSEVYTVRLTSENYAVFSDSIKSIEVVVLVVIVFSAALGLIVVYNLSHINLTERKKELSTFKVLGMTNFEVANYLGRENIICTVFGLGLGLYFGSLFESYVISILETEQVMFIQTINPMSYVYTALLTFLFTTIVNTLIRIKIGKLDLVEAMKAVE